MSRSEARSPFVLAWLVLTLVAVLAPLRAAHAEGAVVDVVLTSDGFSPATVEIAPGQTVRWTVQALGTHEITALDGSWSSGPLLTGGSWSRTFEASGKHGYHDPAGCAATGCTGPTGTVVVTATSEPEPAPQPEPEPEPEPSSSPTSSSSSTGDRTAAATSSSPEPSLAPTTAAAPAPAQGSTTTQSSSADTTPQRSGPYNAAPLYVGSQLADGEATAVQPDAGPIAPVVAPPRGATVASGFEPQAWIGPVPTSTGDDGGVRTRIAAALAGCIALAIAVRRRQRGPLLLDELR